jgi:hypothetical protein
VARIGLRVQCSPPGGFWSRCSATGEAAPLEGNPSARRTEQKANRKRTEDERGGEQSIYLAFDVGICVSFAGSLVVLRYCIVSWGLSF